VFLFITLPKNSINKFMKAMIFFPRININMRFIGAAAIIIGAVFFFTMSLLVGKSSFPLLALCGVAFFFSLLFFFLSMKAIFYKQTEIAEENFRSAKRQIESCSQITKELLVNISSGIRTPMNAIMGFGELLKTSIQNAEQQTYIDSILSSGKQLISLLDGILDISQIEAGYCYSEIIDFDLEYLIESVTTSQRLQIDSKHIVLEVRYPEDVPRHFKGYPSSIRKILINLIGNAVKFTDNGAVTISVNNTTPVHSDTGIARITITIQDTGIGIAAGKQNDIFKAFVQLSPGGLKKIKGRGLGLTVAKALVEMMGGDISVESEPGNGSTFGFSLELATVKPLIDKEISLVPREMLKGKKAMIVDENSHSQFILDNFCKSFNIIPTYSTSSSSDAAQWLETNKEPVDVIFCDITLAETGIFNFPKVVKKIDKQNSIKLIALSANAVPGISARCRNAGFDAYISKPLLNKDLQWLLQTVFGDCRNKKDQIITCHLAREILTKGLSILVVDDDSLNQIAIRSALNRMGCKTVVACNGKEAVEKLHESSFDVVLMDLQMPVVNGFEATRLIRESSNSAIPIIAVTGNSMDENFEKCIAAGMNDFLGKPFGIKILRDKILNVAR
jgi:signal transduction histidine kinase/DNA-binding response OmpR family regulator